MKDIKKISEKELIKGLDESRKTLREIRFGGAGAKLKNVKAGKNTRKEIARILTEISARNREAAKSDVKVAKVAKVAKTTK